MDPSLQYATVYSNPHMYLEREKLPSTYSSFPWLYITGSIEGCEKAIIAV